MKAVDTQRRLAVIFRSACCEGQGAAAGVGGQAKGHAMKLCGGEARRGHSCPHSARRWHR